MSNRGTGPNWDDEEIAKWGFFEFMRMCAAPSRARQAEKDKLLVNEYIEEALSVLGQSSEEDRERLSFAIPKVISCLRMGDEVAQPNWQDIIAKWTYLNWRKRTSSESPQEFADLNPEEQQPFHGIIEAIIRVWKTRTQENPEPPH